LLGLLEVTAAMFNLQVEKADKSTSEVKSVSMGGEVDVSST
jgi:hypothetical protein